MKWWSFLFMLCMAAALLASHAAEVSCGDAVNALIPCGSYLLGNGAADPSSECCASAKNLNNMARTAEARRELCECLKESGPSFGVTPDRANHLPAFCKLNLGIPISPNVDCNNI